MFTTSFQDSILSHISYLIHASYYFILYLLVFVLLFILKWLICISRTYYLSSVWWFTASMKPTDQIQSLLPLCFPLLISFLNLTFRILINHVLSFASDECSRSSFNSLHVDTHFSQHHLFNSLYFFDCMVLWLCSQFVVICASVYSLISTLLH